MRGLVRPIHGFYALKLATPDHSAPAAMSLSRRHHKVNVHKMPELPEVETVRRGLQPVMEGWRIAKQGVRRKELHFTFQRVLAARLRGTGVTGRGYGAE